MTTNINKIVAIALMLAYYDIKNRYRRSVIGPFWLTISMGVMIASTGIVFGRIFNTPMDQYLPFLTVGNIFWMFISGLIIDGCSAFIDSEGMIKQLPISLFAHVLRVLWRNVLILIHNISILPLVLLFMGKEIGLEVLLFIPGLLLVVLCLSWLMLLLAMLCVRYRDLPQIVASVLQVAFYLTPIIWMPSHVADPMSVAFIQINPFYHLLDLVRAPLLGTEPSLISWLVVLIIAVVGWAITVLVFLRLRHRVAYWL